MVETDLLKPLPPGTTRAFSLTHDGQWILFPYDLRRTGPSHA